MNWDMIRSSGIMTIPSSGVITGDNSHLHKKIEQLEKWLLIAIEAAEFAIDPGEFEFPEEMHEWKIEYIARKKKAQEERIV